MNTIPLELFIKITSRLPIHTIKNIALTCKDLNSKITSFHFLRKHILRCYPEYQVCQEKLIKDQIKYIFQMSRKDKPKIIPYEGNNICINGLLIAKDRTIASKDFITENDIKAGDILDYYIVGELANTYVYDEKLNTRLIGKHCDPIENDIRHIYIHNKIPMISKFPHDYFMNLFSPYYIFFDVTRYIKQIKANLKKVDKHPYLRSKSMVSSFIHKFGKKYTIRFNLYDCTFHYELHQYCIPKMVLKFMLLGYYQVGDHNDDLVINYDIIKNYHEKTLW